MSDAYILHDVMRKVKADGLFDSIRRDLISDLEQKVNMCALERPSGPISFRLAFVFRFEIQH